MSPREIITRFITNEFLATSQVKAIPDDLDLVESGIVDSLGLLRMVAFLEEELKVVIEPEDMIPENLRSIGAILSLVKAEPVQER